MGEDRSTGARTAVRFVGASALVGRAGADDGPRTSGSLVLLLAAALLGLVGCSGSTKRNDAGSEGASTSVPAKLVECTVDGAAAATLECQERLYIEAVRKGDFPALADIDDDRLIAFGSGLCAYAQSLQAVDAAGRPSFGDLVSSTSTSWGVDPDVVDAVYRSTQQLCPGGFKILRDLSRSDSSIQVELKVDGTGTANITYFLPGGAVAQKAGVALPWTQVVHQPEPASVSLSVAPIGEGTVGCRISVSGVTVDEQRVAAEPATCDASADSVDRAVTNGGHRG